MDNDTQFDPAAIRMAYFALLLSGRKYDDLELAVAQEMLKMDHLTAERSLPSMVARSVRIRAIINSVEFEETSKRYLIKFMADNGEIWQRDLVGHRVIIFKCKDKVGSKEAPNGYRIAPYCIDGGKAE